MTDCAYFLYYCTLPLLIIISFFVYAAQGDWSPQVGVPAVGVFCTNGLGNHVRAFAGKEQFAFTGLVCLEWCWAHEGKERETADSEVVTSVSRATTAYDAGWAASEGAMKEAAALGEVGVIKLCRSRGFEWIRGDGVFAAAVENGHDDVMLFLIEDGCFVDYMSHKALMVSLKYDRMEALLALDGYFHDSLPRWSGDHALPYGDETKAVKEAAAMAEMRLKRALSDGDAEMVAVMSSFCYYLGPSTEWLVKACYQYARDGDVDMLQGLESFICCEEQEVLENVIKNAAASGQFTAACLCLQWLWESDWKFVPDVVLYYVATHGNLKCLQWLWGECDVVSVGFCGRCVGVEGWSRVPVDAAAAGQAHIVEWCVDNDWEYTDSIVESAVRGDHRGVVRALHNSVGSVCSAPVEVGKGGAGEDRRRGMCEIPRCCDCVD